MMNNHKKPLQVKVVSFFGAFVVSAGSTVFPRLFTTRKEADAVAQEINKTHNL